MAEIGILAKVTFKTPSISIMIYSDSYHFWTVYCINNHSQHSNNIFNEIYTFSTFSSSIHQFQVFHISHFNLFDFRTKKCEKLCYYIFIDFLFFRKKVVAFAVCSPKIFKILFFCYDIWIIMIVEFQSSAHFKLNSLFQCLDHSK